MRVKRIDIKLILFLMTLFLSLNARTVAISRESNKNTGGKKIRGKCGEERWRGEGKKSKGESMKTKSNHNDGNLCG